MKKVILWNGGWSFLDKNEPLEELHLKKFEKVNIPHTWNRFDGQDGGNDYKRGICWYKKEFELTEEDIKNIIYIEFEGVNSIADIFLNGELISHHEGGFSTFRAELTKYVVVGLNTLYVRVDNSANNYIYPQYADFTFFGGIYRDIKLYFVSETRFDLDHSGTAAVKVTPVLNDTLDEAVVTVESYVVNPNEDYTVVYELLNNKGKKLAYKVVPSAVTKIDFEIYNPNLWDGIKNPYLYKIVATLLYKGKPSDRRVVEFGIRKFYVDPEKGFFLNGVSYPLRGVSRHQDRYNKGWAISKENEIQDMKLIKEVGANTIRLAHYQHSQSFYELCDKVGMIVWAEIPFITSYMKDGKENVFSQMKELVLQNYNHPSIMFWGLSNEITIQGCSKELIEDHRELNEFVKRMDPTRLTTIANVSMLEMDSELNTIPDTIAYNHYFGWYTGEATQNAKWLDKFHDLYPNIPLGLSEYGCEAVLNWHSSNPTQGDYTEEYQSLYHEELVKTLHSRPYIWSSYVWNMFDFAADARDEGGVKGRNNKGLVTFDRNTKKDSFFIYKAYWSNEKFVHITGRRFAHRHENEIEVKIYSNCDEVTLKHNEKIIDTKKSFDHIFRFNVELSDDLNEFEAYGKYGNENKYDKVIIRKVEDLDKRYVMPIKREIINWFDKESGYELVFNYPEGFYNIGYKTSELCKNPYSKKAVLEFLEKSSQGIDEEKKSSFDITQMHMPLEKIISLMSSMGGSKVDHKALYELNEVLNKIRVE